LAVGDKLELNDKIRNFKLQNGSLNYNKILSIPFSDRLFNLLEKVGYKEIHMVLGASIQLAMESLNLSKPLFANQIIDIVDVILEECTEDSLAIEDVILFLQKLTRGESGNLFSSIDVAKFFQLFEKYREDRHKEYMRIKYEMEVQYKCIPHDTFKLPDGLRKDKEIDSNSFYDLLQTYNEGKNDKLQQNPD
jgi:hypothetical protein